jgi:hypothetical protein
MTYRTLVRQGSFMRPRRKGQAEFTLVELLALKAFALLRAHGLRSGIAAAAIQRAYPSITTFATDGRLQVGTSYQLGVRLMSVRGRLIAATIGGPAPHGAEEVGRVELDLRGVAALLPAQRNTSEQSQRLFDIGPGQPFHRPASVQRAPTSTECLGPK